jgi:hypothetical protein
VRGFSFQICNIPKQAALFLSDFDVLLQLFAITHSQLPTDSTSAMTSKRQVLLVFGAWYLLN